jgi:iron complex outermembrane receptor protein
MKNFLSLTLFLITLNTFAQMMPGKGAISGRIVDLKSGEELTGAVITVENNILGSVSDIEGNYQIKNINPGNYTILCKSLG